ncbi:MAG: PHP domain-containing protein [Bdellovibrionota bacterium]
MSFVHLHNHSAYSLLKGMLSFDELCKQAAAFGMPAVAMTDYGNLHGAYEFFKPPKSTMSNPSSDLISPWWMAMHVNVRPSIRNMPWFFWPKTTRA